MCSRIISARRWLTEKTGSYFDIVHFALLLEKNRLSFTAITPFSLVFHFLAHCVVFALDLAQVCYGGVAFLLKLGVIFYVGFSKVFVLVRE